MQSCGLVGDGVTTIFPHIADFTHTSCLPNAISKVERIPLGVKLGKVSLGSIIQARQSSHGENSTANAIADAILRLSSY